MQTADWPQHGENLRRHVVHSVAVYGGGEWGLVRGLDLWVILVHVSQGLELLKQKKPIKDFFIDKTFK